MKRKMMAAAAGLAVIATSTACGGDKPETFTVTGYFGGTIMDESKIHAGSSCEFMDGTVRVGEALILKGASGQILGKALLTAGTMKPVVCQLGYKFEGVPAGQSGYTLELESGTYPAVTATEADLRATAANITVRDPLGVVWGKTSGKVKMDPYNG